MKLLPGAGQRIYEARERAGLSRADVERATAKQGRKVAEATIYNIERGLSKAPYPRNIYAIASVLGLDVVELMVMEEAVGQ